MQTFLLFTTAFDKISHTYLLRMLKCYGYSMKFITLIQTLWYKTFFSVQINGYIARPFPTRCSVTQSHPMSMILFALISNPLICLCNGGRLGEQFDQHAGLSKLPGNNYIPFSDLRVISPLRECHLVADDRQDQSPDERHVRSRIVSKTLNPVCAYIIALQDMAHRTDFPDLDGARATGLNVDILVYMAWCELWSRPFFGEE
jgi:hypothetical protein